MIGSRQLIRLITISLILVIGQCAIAQDGILSAERSYYNSPRVANYPFLAGTEHTATVVPQHESFHHAGGLDSGCGFPIIPTLAQGLRDTLDCLFPCRGLNRGRGLLFSHRFYGSGCHGCGDGIPGIIYENDGSGEPTPAVPEEVVPATPAATLRSLSIPDGYSVLNRAAGRVGTAAIQKATAIRPASFRIPQTVQSIKKPAIPQNPLRR